MRQPFLTDARCRLPRFKSLQTNQKEGLKPQAEGGCEVAPWLLACGRVTDSESVHAEALFHHGGSSGRARRESRERIVLDRSVAGSRAYAGADSAECGARRASPDAGRLLEAGAGRLLKSPAELASSSQQDRCTMAVVRRLFRFFTSLRVSDSLDSPSLPRTHTQRHTHTHTPHTQLTQTACI